MRGMRSPFVLLCISNAAKGCGAVVPMPTCPLAHFRKNRKRIRNTILVLCWYKTIAMALALFYFKIGYEGHR
jgi:hypothetical protein